ncbi:MAG: hypothetical protein KAU27_08850, partial [Desulfuromonadales bacterium]|nr:hypothetical protein [Desulfuromonadales bacterium]
MSQYLDKKPLLNRITLHHLQQAGLGDLAEDLLEINSARKFALWHQGSGIEVYLFTLLTAAARQMALHYFSQSALQPGIDKVDLAGAVHALPELGTAYREFLHCYPREELTVASDSGANAAEILARQRLIGEMFVLEALLDNPATQSFRELFDDTELITRFDYHALIDQLVTLQRPSIEDAIWGQRLPELLRAPMRAAPHSLAEQASYIVQHWAAWLPESIITKVQLACAITAEENRPHLPGPGPSPSPLFGKGDGSDAPAAFTADIDWMASSVLLAKSIYVWLNQLSNR